MLSTLFAIVVLGLLVLSWMAGARARELATRLGKDACQRHGYQFLDDSVALQRFAPRWTSQGLRLRRMYRFEYSVDGALREVGHVILLGLHLESIHIRGHHTFEQETPQPSTPTERPSAKVIPFPGKGRR